MLKSMPLKGKILVHILVSVQIAGFRLNVDVLMK